MSQQTFSVGKKKKIIIMTIKLSKIKWINKFQAKTKLKRLRLKQNGREEIISGLTRKENKKKIKSVYILSRIIWETGYKKKKSRTITTLRAIT